MPDFVLGPQMEAFRATVEEHPEQWKADHADAMKCINLEGLLGLAIFLYDMVCAGDRRWRYLVANGQSDYDADTDNGLDALFHRWLDLCTKVEKEVRRIESKGYPVERADEFRERLTRARSTAADR